MIAIIIPLMFLVVSMLVNWKRVGRWKLIPAYLFLCLFAQTIGLLLLNMSEIYIVSYWDLYTLGIETVVVFLFVVLQRIYLYRKSM